MSQTKSSICTRAALALWSTDALDAFHLVCLHGGILCRQHLNVLAPLVAVVLPNTEEAQVATVHFLIRKLGHFTEYAILAFLARRAFITSSRAFLRQHWFQLACCWL